MLKLAKAIMRASPASVELQEKLLFFGRVGYWPNFKQPRTLNEKVNWRKLYSSNPMFVTCSDKLAVRKFVAERVGEKYLIPVLFSGESITAEQILALGDDIVVKTNHDCGSVFLIDKNTPELAAEVCAKISASLKRDFGRLSNQWWYSQIPPRVYVEKRLEGMAGGPPLDFKFSLFRGEMPDDPRRGILKVDYDRKQATRARTFFDLNRKFLPGIHRSEEQRPFPEVENYQEMLSVATRLAADFDYVRVDLYNVDGRVYFGELTFSQTGGRSGFTREADLKLGSWWPLDIREGGPERPRPDADGSADTKAVRREIAAPAAP